LIGPNSSPVNGFEAWVVEDRHHALARYSVGDQAVDEVAPPAMIVVRRGE